MDRERRKAVREGVAQLRQHWAENCHTATMGEARPQNLSEALALLAAACRDEGVDEGLHAEIVLRVARFEFETLREARRVLALLGYSDVARVVQRLEPKAPRRGDRMARRKPSEPAPSRVVTRPKPSIGEADRVLSLLRPRRS